MSTSEAELRFISTIKFKPKNKANDIRMPKNIPLVSVESLIPYPNNSKIHTKQQVAKICSAIDKACQWTQPIIVDGDNVIIAGHGRRFAAMAYGLKEVPVIKIKGISKEDAAILRIADNKVAEGEIDTNMLESELKILADFGIDMLGIMDERELDFMIEDLGEIDLGAMTDDVSADVARQFDENEKIAEKADEKTQRLSDIFGKRPLNKNESRALIKYMAYIEENYGLTGIDALVEHAIDYVEEQENAEVHD